MELTVLLEQTPVVPFIRECDYAVRKPWSMFERRLLDYLFIYVQEGILLIHAEGVEYRFEAGQFCLLQPGCLHTLRGITDTITPFAHMDIFYNSRRKESFPTRPAQTDLTPYPHLLQPRLNDFAGIDIPVRFEPSDPFRYRDTFLRMVESWNRHDPLSRLEAQNLASELVLSLLQTYLSSGKPSVPENSLKWMSSYLHLHLAEPLTIEQMAERASLSPSRFRAVFKEQFGLPPHQYLLHLRIRHAQDLLKQSGHSLQEIALFCGFADIHHFVKSFKKEVGRPPGQYRKEFRESKLRLQL